jgi:hypothetical protein
VFPANGPSEEEKKKKKASYSNFPIRILKNAYYLPD